MKSNRVLGMSRTTALVAMVGAALGAVVLVGGTAVLVSSVGASPLLVAVAATLAAGASGYLLATTATTVRRLRAERRTDDEPAASIALPPTAQFVRVDGEELALLDLGSQVSSALRKELDQGLLETGRPFRSGGPLGHACLPLAGAGAGVATSLSAGNVFVATADPATLMTIGKGLGSAIMGPTGIVGQAPFVPAAVAIMPVVAPVLLLNTLSSMTMAIRFDRIEKTLASLAEALSHLLANRIAEDAARFLSAWERLSDLHEEYSKGPGFTGEMKARLALIERDVNVLRHKHHVLATRSVASVAAAKLSKNDQRLFVASSIADVQVDQLRLLLALQDNPADASRRLSALQKKVQVYENDFRSLAEKNEEFKTGLRRSVKQMNWWARHVLRKDKALKEVLREVEGNVGQGALNEPAGAKQPAVDPAEGYSILFWRDNDGAGELTAWCTADYHLKEHEGSSPPPVAASTRHSDAAD